MYLGNMFFWHIGNIQTYLLVLARVSRRVASLLIMIIIMAPVQLLLIFGILENRVFFVN